MIKVEYKLRLGLDEFTLIADVKDEKEFFEKMSFYASLPRSAPGGSTDLKLQFRTTTKGYRYYSIVSETEKMEFQFGQENVENGGLFPKGWKPLFEGSEEEQQQQPAAKTSTTFAPKTNQFAPQAAKTNVSAPVQSSVPSFAPPAITPETTQTQSAAPAAPAQNVNKMANDVLARFNIGAKK